MPKENKEDRNYDLMYVCQQSSIQNYIVCRLKFPTILVIYQVITVIISGECVNI